MRGWIDTLLKKIFLIISRGRLIAIDNDDAEMQKIQISNLANETITDIERYQEYGFENYPVIANGEAITLFINGNRNASKGINIRINNRKLRPIDLESGEVRIYCIDSDNTSKNHISLRPTDNTIELKTKDDKIITVDTNKIEIVDADGNTITIDSNGMAIEDANGNKFELTSSGTKITDSNSNTIEMAAAGVKINSTNLEVLP